MKHKIALFVAVLLPSLLAAQAGNQLGVQIQDSSGNPIITRTAGILVLKQGTGVSLSVSGNTATMNISGTGSGLPSVFPNPGLGGYYAALANLSANMEPATGTALTPKPVIVYGFGDSIMAGCCLTGAGGTNTFAGNYAAYFPLLQKALWDKYGYGGTGIVRQGANGQTETGTWNDFANYGPYWSATHAGSIYASGTGNSFNVAGVGDTCVVYYYPNTDTGAGFTVSIDGVSSGTFGAATGTPILTSASVAMGPSKHHNCKVTAPATGNVYLFGVELTAGTGGARVSNFAMGGSTSNAAGSIATQYNWMASPNIPAPNLVILSYGANDWANSVSLATYSSNLTNIVNQTSAVGASSFILDEEYTCSVSQCTQSTEDRYKAIESSLSISLGTGFASISDRWGWYTQNQAFYYTTGPNDFVHPSILGHSDIARFVAPILIPDSQPTPPSSFAYGAPSASGTFINQLGPMLLTDITTPASGTAPLATFNSYAQPTLGSYNGNTIATTAAGNYIAGPPIAGVSETINVSAGQYIDGGTTVQGGGANSYAFGQIVRNPNTTTTPAGNTAAAWYPDGLVNIGGVARKAQAALDVVPTTGQTLLFGHDGTNTCYYLTTGINCYVSTITISNSNTNGGVNIYQNGSGTVKIGVNGVGINRIAKYTAALTPASVAANTCAEQIFTVTGIAATDIIYVNKPTAQAGLPTPGVRASAANTVGLNFCNLTASPITPTAETYSFGVIQ